MTDIGAWTRDSHAEGPVIGALESDVDYPSERSSRYCRRPTFNVSAISFACGTALEYSVCHCTMQEEA
jgi:hypothetical protein